MSVSVPVRTWMKETVVDHYLGKEIASLNSWRLLIKSVHSSRSMFVYSPGIPAPLPFYNRASQGNPPKGIDTQRIAALLSTFDFKHCEARRELIHQFSTGISHKELCSVAAVLSEHFQIQKVSRDACRSYPMLIKWFQDNWAEIKPLLPLVTILDSHDHVINHEREMEYRKHHCPKRRSRAVMQKPDS
jgi:hypothetical protein